MSRRSDSAAMRVLLVDDDADLLVMLSRILIRKGHHVDTAENGAVALELLRADAYDVVISDVRMPELDGLKLLEEARACAPQTQIILLTGYGSVEDAVSAMKNGAYDYITKPPNPDEILLLLERLAEARSLRELNTALARELSEHHGMHGIVGEHASMTELFGLIDRVAQTDSTVLIRGESGVGKELVARAIHERSARSGKPFIVVNCAAMSTELLENELFGHERGAFTDASERRLGKFEVADKGTIFLDEIGATGPGLQQALLRVLQERCFERVGGAESIEVDVRVLAATNADLEEMVAQRQFRDDLYYRLNVVGIDVPPLRDRSTDIPLLARHFLEKYRGKVRRRVDGIEPKALERLSAYSWPGNVRELENVIERAVVLGAGPTISLEDLPHEITGLQSTPLPVGAQSSLRDQVENFERDLILRALRHCEGNQTKAAELLGISRSTLSGKIAKYDVPLD